MKRRKGRLHFARSLCVLLLVLLLIVCLPVGEIYASTESQEQTTIETEAIENNDSAGDRVTQSVVTVSEPMATPTPTPEPTSTTAGETISDAEATPLPEVTEEAVVTDTPEATKEPETTPEPDATADASVIEEAGHAEPTTEPDAVLTPEATEAIEELSEEEVTEEGPFPYDDSVGWEGVENTDERGMAIPMLYQYSYRQPVCCIDGRTRSVATSGCGATSLSMVIAYLTGDQEQNPYILFTQSYEEGRYYGNGWSHNTLSHYASKYGIKSRWIDNSASRIRQALEEGKPVIAHMGPGIFTGAGHYIVLRGIAEDGKILVNDPNSAYRTEKKYPLETIIRQARVDHAFMVCWIEGKPSEDEGETTIESTTENTEEVSEDVEPTTVDIKDKINIVDIQAENESVQEVAIHENMFIIDPTTDSGIDAADDIPELNFIKEEPKGDIVELFFIEEEPQDDIVELSFIEEEPQDDIVELTLSEMDTTDDILELTFENAEADSISTIGEAFTGLDQRFRAARKFSDLIGR